jgi:hypothetical protein
MTLPVRRLSPQRARPSRDFSAPPAADRLPGGGRASSCSFRKDTVRMLRRPLSESAPSSSSRSSGSPTSVSSASVPAIGRELTLSFDARPAFSEFDSFSQRLDASTAGSLGHLIACCSVRSCQFLDGHPARALGQSRTETRRPRQLLLSRRRPSSRSRMSAKDRVESWWGWSWKLPRGWCGTNSWKMLVRIHDLRPALALLRDAQLQRQHCNTSSKPASAPTPARAPTNAAYAKSSRCSGRKWLGFYMHAVWRSSSNGVLEIWYRVGSRSALPSSTRTRLGRRFEEWSL